MTINIIKSDRLQIVNTLCYAIGIVKRKNPLSKELTRRELLSILAWILININAVRDLQKISEKRIRVRRKKVS